jgi:glycosyltransferase involved in cell wall biosynthesis
MPLISCILRSRLPGRAAARVVDYFLRQTYPRTELIIIDDSESPGECDYFDPRIRYLQIAERLNDAKFRNLACREARGEIIAHWDERFWYAPEHLTSLAGALIASNAEIAGCERVFSCDTKTRQVRQIRFGDAVAYRRKLWERVPFSSGPAQSGPTSSQHLQRAAVATDFVTAIGFDGAAESETGSPAGFGDLRAILGCDIHAHLPGVPLEPLLSPQAEYVEPASSSWPRLSCVLVARNHDAASRAIQYFREQDYTAKELVVVDAGAAISGMLDEGDVHVVAAAELSSLEALDLGWENATGEFIMHWGEWDWSGPERARSVVAALLAAGADVAGSNPAVFCDAARGEAAAVHRPDAAGFLCGVMSLCYRRSLGRRALFSKGGEGDELSFFRATRAARRIGAADEGNRVAFGPLPPGPYRYAYPVEAVQSLVGEGYSLYTRAPSKGPAVEPVAAPPLISEEIYRPEPYASTGPMASCVIPTRDQPEFVQHAIDYFNRQDYPNRELIIIDDGARPLDHLIPADPRIRYIQCAPITLGAKRNLACEQARGEFILHWDDDCWQSPSRIQQQVETLQSQNAELCGSASLLAAEPRSERAWFYRCPITENTFWAAGATFCYRKSLWQRAPFPDVDLAEDRQFLWNVRDARMAETHWSLTVCLVHPNSRIASDPEGPYWPPTHASDARALMGADWSRYAPRKPAQQAHPAEAMPRPRVHVNAQALVSCIMPTRNRRKFVPLAIQMFLRQDYEPKELVILDDGEDRIEDLIPADDRFRYIRMAGTFLLGAKRNLGASIARGGILMHWDDDDWQAPSRIRDMAATLEQTGADLCGMNPIHFYDTRSGLAWLYQFPAEERFWVAGTSFCYRRSFWEGNRFAEISVGEDSQFLWAAPRGKMMAMPDAHLQVAILHDGNGSPKTIGDEYWQARQPEEIQALMGADFQFYKFEPPLASLNLGCGDNHIPGMWNVDRALPADQVVDLRFAWPWADSSVDYIVAHDVFEHLPDKIHTMNEAWRVLRPGGRIEIAVPTTNGTGAFQDPTHTSFWNRRSFLYFEAGNPYRERFAWSYGISAAFNVFSERLDDSMDGERLTIVLEAIR